LKVALAFMVWLGPCHEYMRDTVLKRGYFLSHGVEYRLPGIGGGSPVVLHSCGMTHLDTGIGLAMSVA